jgi:mRNA interferase MazF
MNNTIATVIIAPMTTKSHQYPTRIELKFKNKNAWIVLDQIRTVDKKRLINRLGKIDKKIIIKVKGTIGEMLVE